MAHNIDLEKRRAAVFLRGGGKNIRGKFQPIFVSKSREILFIAE